uniref:Uncharacterized protein n=1 Tax=Angiostrongylus cantonensis TaxID=6313 RepID=A0A0K0DHW6_ANGCA
MEWNALRRTTMRSEVRARDLREAEHMHVSVTLDGEGKSAQNACPHSAANMVNAGDHMNASASPVGAESSVISILGLVLVMVSSAKTAAPASLIQQTPTDAAALRPKLKEWMSKDERKWWVSAEVTCEFGTGSRDDFVLITLLLSILALSLAIITLIVKFVCDKLAVIQKTTIQNPFNCSTHWVTTEVHFRNGIRRNYNIANGGNLELDYGSGLSVTLNFVLF